MATIYDATNGYVISDALQGASASDEAMQIAKRIAAERDEDVILEDCDEFFSIASSGEVELLDRRTARGMGFCE